MPRYAALEDINIISKKEIDVIIKVSIYKKFLFNLTASNTNNGILNKIPEDIIFLFPNKPSNSFI